MRSSTCKSENAKTRTDRETWIHLSPVHAQECSPQFYSNTIFFFSTGPSHPLGAQGGCTPWWGIALSCFALVHCANPGFTNISNSILLKDSELDLAFCIVMINTMCERITEKSSHNTPLKRGDIIPPTLEMQQDLAMKYWLVQWVEFDNS